MRNPNNAVADTIEALHMTNSVRETVTLDPNNNHRWTIRFESKPNALVRSFMVVEIIEEDDGDASVCVLRRFNVGRSVMIRIMDTLVDNLEDLPRLEGPWVQPPVGGEPRAAQQ
jgi:hypothetical protein